MRDICGRKNNESMDYIKSRLSAESIMSAVVGRLEVKYVQTSSKSQLYHQDTQLIS